MADEKKPKIDLKARLGKKTVQGPSGGPSIPPPVGIPKPSGVPVPPFAGQEPKKKAPKVDASDPYASISADDAPAKKEPQAIKIEMSEEVVQAQKKGKARIIALAIVTALVGAGIGFAVGSGVEKGKRQDVAVEGAALLVKDVDTAVGSLTELNEVLKSANNKLKTNKYPEEEVKKLGAINVDFDANKLTGRGIGLFKPTLVNQLMRFAAGASEANDQKESLQSLLGGVGQKQIKQFLTEQEKPQVRWSVYVRGGPHGPWGIMQRLPKPFPVKDFEADKKKKEEKEKEKEEKDKDKDKKDDEEEKKFEWPKEFKIKDGGKEYDLKRYTGGDPTRDSDPKIIPVDPSSQSSVCPSDTLIQLRREVITMQRVLMGDKTPGREKDGLIQLGEQIVEQLKNIGGPG